MVYVHSITAGHAATDAAPTASPAAASAVSTGFSSGDQARRTSPRDPYADAVRRYEGGQVVWRVQCGDLISRERCVTVFVEDDEVVLVGPPGETARLTKGQLGQLRAALNEAAELAER